MPADCIRVLKEVSGVDDVVLINLQRVSIFINGYF